MSYGPEIIRGADRSTCIPQYGNDIGGLAAYYPQDKASLGSAVNISFAGVPPFDLSRRVWLNQSIQCGPVFTTLNETWFMWQVEPFNETNGDPREYGLEGQAIQFLALERNGTDEQRLFNSANYTITKADSGSSGARAQDIQGPIVKGLAVVALLFLPALLSL